MLIRKRLPAFDFDVEDSLEAKDQSRPTGVVEGPIGCDHQVGPELGTVLGEDRCQARATDLLLALEEKLYIHRELGMRPQSRCRARDHAEQLTFVVRGAAAVEPVVTDRRLERWRGPFSDRLDGLYVVVSVEQHRRSTASDRRLAEDRGVPGPLEDFALKPHVPEGLAEPFSRVPHRVAVSRDAGYPDKGAQEIEVRLTSPLELPGQRLVSHAHEIACLSPWSSREVNVEPPVLAQREVVQMLRHGDIFDCEAQGAEDGDFVRALPA